MWSCYSLIKLSLLSFIVASTSYAKVEVGIHATVVLNDLAKLGIKKVGELDLAQLQKDADEVQWEFSVYRPPQEVAGSRRSAFYVPDERKVIVSITGSPVSAESLELLELHETLGVLGYRDHTYAQSSALNILRKAPSSSLRKNLVDTYGKTIFSKENLMVAGGSSVGGGGDITAIIIKNRVIDEVMTSNITVDPDFYVQYPEINFEPFLDVTNQFVGIQYEFKLKDSNEDDHSFRGSMAGNSYQELFTVYFPALKWESTKNQKQIVSEIKTKLLGLFPTYSESPKSQIIPEGCRHGMKVVYPKTEDSGIRIIQSLRSSVMLGCLNRSMIVSGLTVKSPSW